MTKLLRHISRIRDDFDIVICGVNGVLVNGEKIIPEGIDALIKLYQSGKKVALASNSGLRVRELFVWLKNNGVPMNIFYAMITAGEIAHFYLKHNQQLGKYYLNVGGKCRAIRGLPFVEINDVLLSNFLLTETTNCGINITEAMPIMEKSLRRNLPLLCIGNDTAVVTAHGIKDGAGTLAEQFAMMGGKIISFGKPDLRIASYLTEEFPDLKANRCLFIGDAMATDVRLGNNFGGKTLLITSGIHQIYNNVERQVSELSAGYGLNVDYCMENLQW